MAASCLERAAEFVLRDVLVAGTVASPDCVIELGMLHVALLVPDLAPEEEEYWGE